MTDVAGRPDAAAALRSWLIEHGTLIGAAAAHAEAGTLRGRGQVRVVPAPPGPWPQETRWVVRHYHRGGAIASLLGDRYPRGSRPRPFREFELTRAAEVRGIPTAPPVGAAVYPHGLFYRGDLVTEFVSDSSDLGAVLFGSRQLDESAVVTGAASGAGAMDAAGRLVRLSHEQGLVHPDLNIKNILIAPGDEGPRALIIDLDRARLLDSPVPRHARRRMLDRFERSLRKWQHLVGDAPVAQWLDAFYRGYDAPSR